MKVGSPCSVTIKQTRVFAACAALRATIGKLEYLYLDLGSLDTTNPFPPAIPSALFKTTPFAGTFTTHTHFTDNIVRVGLNYQFH
jgi:hypothetical protein